MGLGEFSLKFQQSSYFFQISLALVIFVHFLESEVVARVGWQLKIHEIKEWLHNNQKSSHKPAVSY